MTLQFVGTGTPTSLAARIPEAIEAAAMPEVNPELFTGLDDSHSNPLQRTHYTTVLDLDLRVRVHIIGHLQPCMTDIYLHIVARMADYMDTHPYTTLTWHHSRSRAG